MSDRTETAHRSTLETRADDTLLDLRHLASGLGTATLALGVLIGLLLTAITTVIGVGLLALPTMLTAVHAVAERERRRLNRRTGTPEVLLDPGPLPTGLRSTLTDPILRRELGWTAVHGTAGFLIGLVGVALPLSGIRDISVPLWWYLVPEGEATPSMALWKVYTWPSALAVLLLGIGWLALTLFCSAGLDRLQTRPGYHLLTPGPNVDLSLRVAELTATRAAALDAHATELRRIERSLHDGTQNRLVAVTVLLGAARRALTRDPASADAILERAQSAAEQALAELRAVGRGILPPVLADRGLAGALSGLAANCAVPCQVDVVMPDRCAASVEATAYFVVAEALTNIARHSRAEHATVVLHSRNQRLHLKITDDGQGGAPESSSGPDADPGHGSGLIGIRRRIEAHDGSLTVTSPPGGPTTLLVELPCGS
jgi:signal transduction histidine kinase